MAPESAECSLSDASPDDGSEDARDREHSLPPSDSSDDGRELAPRARLATGTRAVASAERGLGGLARPRPRDLESAPPHAPRARAERPRGARPHGVRLREERCHEERGHAQEQQPSSPRLCQTTQAQAAQSVRARGSTRAPPRWPYCPCTLAPTYTSDSTCYAASEYGGCILGGMPTSC